jgi:segregation and condensation protein B
MEELEELEIVPEGVSPQEVPPKEETPQPEASADVTSAVLPPVSSEPAVSEPDGNGNEVIGTAEVEDTSGGKTADAAAEPEAAATPGSTGESDEATADAPAEPEVMTAGAPASVSMEELLGSNEPVPEPVSPATVEDSQLRAVLEAIVYVAEEPLTLAQISTALQQPAERVRTLLEQLVAEFDRPEHGVTVREVAGGYKMATKAEHHEAVRSFVKSLKPPLKLSLPALETLAVIAYKQPVTSPEIMEIRGVRGAGVLNTLLDRKLIAAAGRKNVIGKPILYKTTKEFLIQFGLKDLSELPSLKEFEEIRRMAFADSEVGGEEQPTENVKNKRPPADDALPTTEGAAPPAPPEPSPVPDAESPDGSPAAEVGGGPEPSVPSEPTPSGQGEES